MVPIPTEKGSSLKVKVFHTIYSVSSLEAKNGWDTILEKKINSWLAGEGADLDIVDVRFSCSQLHSVVIIFYKV